jgi:hypothetical protein
MQNPDDKFVGTAIAQGGSVEARQPPSLEIDGRRYPGIRAAVRVAGVEDGRERDSPLHA